jgi:hypothetical protein
MVGELSMEGPNLFIDFNIIKKSKLAAIVEEFDKVIRVGKSIFVWSKETSIDEMSSYCKSQVIVRSPKEVEVHAKCHELRIAGKIYKEISDELKIPVSNVSYYITTDPFRDWLLDDWIQDYLAKESNNYQKVDVLVDNDPKVVARFLRNGIPSQYIESIK